MQYRNSAVAAQEIPLRERDDGTAASARRIPLRKRLRLITSVCFLLTVLIWFHFVSDGLRLFAADPGVGWHIASGHYVLQHAAVPHLDPFLGYVPPLPWVSDQWASDLFLAVGYQVGGWPLLYNVLLAGYFAIYFAGLFTVLRAEHNPTVAAFVGAMFAAKVGEIHFILRPTMVGFLLCVGLLYGICQLERRLSGGNSRHQVWRPVVGFAVLFGVWANLHPSFVLGYTLLTVYLVVRMAVCFLRKQPAHVVFTAGILLASLAATVVNPYGLELHRSIVVLGNSTFFMRLHQEWLPLDVMSGEGRAFEIAVAILLLHELFLQPKGTSRSPRWFAEMAVILLLAHGTLAHVRILPYFGIMVAPALTRSIVGIGRAVAQLLARPFPGFVALCTGLIAWEDRAFSGVGATLCLSAPCLLGAASGRVLGMTGPLGPPRAEFPYHAVAVLRQATAALGNGQAEPRPSRILAPADWGGFITLYGEGLLHPLFDDRNTLIGEARYKEFLRKTGSCPAWIRFGTQLNADFVLLPKRSNPIEDCLSRGEFQVLFQDSVAVVLAPTRSTGEE